jgi:DNA-binding Lrp family transcriptional regulator
MGNTFFEELNNENLTGVAYKNLNLKKNVLAYFANVSNATIADLGKELNISVPKITAILNDLIQDGLVQDFGKVAETKGGRKPNMFGLLPESAFFIGVDVNQNHLNIALSDLQKNLVKIVDDIPYLLENNKESLELLCKLINKFISNLTIPKDKILGIGINLSGRVNYATGYSYSFFHFNEEPLRKVIESKVGIKVFPENDSRSMAFGEFNSGVVTDEKDVLFVNMDYGIGLEF